MMSRSPAFSLSPSCLHLLLSLLHISFPLSLVLSMSLPHPASSTGALCIPDSLTFVFYPAFHPSHPPGLWIQTPSWPDDSSSNGRNQRASGMGSVRVSMDVSFPQHPLAPESWFPALRPWVNCSEAKSTFSPCAMEQIHM